MLEDDHPEPSLPGMDDPRAATIEGLIGAEILQGQYVIRDFLGRGAMGAVYIADQPSMGRQVAVKVLLPDVTLSEGLVERFTREARLASRLTHPNSVQVHLFGRLDDGTMYTVMELLQGEDVRDLVDREAPLPLHRALRIVLQVLAALSEAHGLGIVHRDLKPANVFLTTTAGMGEYVKVLDYGIGKLLQPDSAEEMRSLTEAGTVFGTPEYMAPEQCRGERVTPGADLYSVAIMLYELLSGRYPFDAQTPLDYLARHVAADPTPLGLVLPGAPPPVERVIMRNLAKEPGERSASAAAFAAELVAAWEKAARASALLPAPDLEGIHLPRPASGEVIRDVGPAMGQPIMSPEEAATLATADTPLVGSPTQGERPDSKEDANEPVLAEPVLAAPIRMEPILSDAEPIRAEPAEPAPEQSGGTEIFVWLALLLVFGGAATGIYFATRGPAPGSVVIDTEPPGARILLGENPEARSPARFDEVEPGTYPLSVALPGYQPVSEKVELSEGEELVRRYDLARARVTLTIAVDAEGAILLVGREGRLERFSPPPVSVADVAVGEGVVVEVYAPGRAPLLTSILPPTTLEDGSAHHETLSPVASEANPSLRAVLFELGKREKDFRPCLPADAPRGLQTDLALTIKGGAVAHARVIGRELFGTDAATCIERTAREVLAWPTMKAGAVGHHIASLAFAR